MNHNLHTFKSFLFPFSASSYKQQRQASIQEDLNQLYDTRPTLASQYQRSSGIESARGQWPSSDFSCKFVSQLLSFCFL
jgi:hypothetical protein